MAMLCGVGGLGACLEELGSRRGHLCNFCTNSTSEATILSHFIAELQLFVRSVQESGFMHRTGPGMVVPAKDDSRVVFFPVGNECLRWSTRLDGVDRLALGSWAQLIAAISPCWARFAFCPSPATFQNGKQETKK